MRLRSSRRLCLACVLLALSASALPDLSLSRPDYVVFRPTQPADAKMADPTKTGDGYNDHFQVIWDETRRLYYAFWTQATHEGSRDMHLCFSKSADLGKTWCAPKVLAGSVCVANPRPRAVWQQPMLAKSGRLYCLWNQQAGAEALHHGLIYGSYSDDAGETWTAPEENRSIPRQYRDDPKGEQLPNWCNWQRPLRLGDGGRFLVGCTRHVKPADVKDAPERTIGSWVEFWRYENIDENPAVRDIRITVLSGGRNALEIAIPGTNRFCCEEASLAKLPDGRLFALLRSRARHPFWSQSRDGGETWSRPVPLKDAHGKPYLHPNSPCPLYDIRGCEAASGDCLALIHNAYDDAIPPLGRQNRGPLYLIRGTFDQTGEQPLRFGEPEPFLPLPSDNACYSSYTVADGQGILWFGHAKRFLIGRKIQDPAEARSARTPKISGSPATTRPTSSGG